VPRKPLDLDLTELEKLAAMHCTQEEVAAWFGTTHKTISLKLRQEPYKSAWERGLGKGNISLRRQQFARAEAGDKTMLIWLGKQWLGQKDVRANEHTGADGKPIEVVTGAYKTLEDELAAFIESERERGV